MLPRSSDLNWYNLIASKRYHIFAHKIFSPVCPSYIEKVVKTWSKTRLRKFHFLFFFTLCE